MTCVKQVPVCVTAPVHDTKTIDVCRLEDWAANGMTCPH
jgi:hypothetical protein